MFKSYLFVMSMQRAPGLPLAEAAPALFDALAELYAPRRLVYAIDDGELSYLTRSEHMRWNGEELTGDALTLCSPGEASELIAELRRALAAAQPTQLWVGADGALRHRAPGTSEPAWFGRWRRRRSLTELVEPSFAWTDEDRCVEIRFPLAGYPLTSVRLRSAPDGERWLDEGDRDAAVENRRLVFDVLGRIPAALGLARGDVQWELHGDTVALEARYPDDARAVGELFAQLLGA